MVKRNYSDKQSQDNYLDNMRALCWQEHIIKYDKERETFILGVSIDNQNYFREIVRGKMRDWINADTVYDNLLALVDEMAREVIKWKETVESKEYQEWIKNNKNE